MNSQPEGIPLQTRGRIAEAFGVRDDQVRRWRSDVMKGGVEALKAIVVYPLFYSDQCREI